MFQKDKTIGDYKTRFEAAEKQYRALYTEIRSEQFPFSEDNPRREEFILRMSETIDLFYDNYNNIYRSQLKEAAEIEHIKFKNRY